MIINFGSINTDHVYQVERMPGAGETLTALGYAKHLGGKGINQSVAVAKANGALRHVGCVNADDGWIIDQIEQLGVSTDHIARIDEATGHAIICIDRNGENQIVICGAANQCLQTTMIDVALSGVDGAGNWVLFQNETNLTHEIAHAARAAGFRVVYSAAPFSADLTVPLLPLVDLVVVNETEAAELAVSCGTSPQDIPVAMLLITKGSAGSDLWLDDTHVHQAAFTVEAVDTTGAGDTFLGSFLAIYDETGDAKAALRYASAASALQVTGHGAATSIPSRSDVEKFLESQTT